MKMKIIVSLPEKLVGLFDKDTVLEAYFDGTNLVVNTLDEEDIDSFVCDEDCTNCPIQDDRADFIPCPDDTDCVECLYHCSHCNRCVFDE